MESQKRDRRSGNASDGNKKPTSTTSRFVRERLHRIAQQIGIHRSTLSRILLGNDSWEVFEGIPKHFSFRARVRMKLKFSSLGVAWELFQTAFAIIVSVLYVAQTYYPTVNTDTFDLAAVIVFTTDYLLNLYCCDNRPTEVVIDDASSLINGEEICNHIVVVSDLDHVSMAAFVRMLRLERHVRGSEDYHPIIFLSWSTKSAVMAVRMLQEYADVFLMLATHDSKTELLRANILTAKSCVLLADKTAIQQLDGEVIDAKTIFHYLAILSIQEENGIDVMSEEFMPLVELTVPRTMKILDMEMKKRFKASIQRQQQLDRLQCIASNDNDDLVKVVEAENNRQDRKIKRRGSKNIVKSMYQQGAENISTLETHIKLQQRIQYRRSMIRRQQTLIEKAYFESGGTSVLPFFAAGYGFSVDIFDNILCQSFFTPGLIRFIYELLFSDNGQPSTKDGGAPGTNVSDHHASSKTHHASESHADETKIASSLVQIHVPTAFVGSTFGDMFAHLTAKEDIVAIGLYRRKGTQHALPYVAAGPAMDTVLVSDDMVFVLAQPEALKREQASRHPQSEHPNQERASHTSPMHEVTSNTK